MFGKALDIYISFPLGTFFHIKFWLQGIFCVHILFHFQEPPTAAQVEAVVL